MALEDASPSPTRPADSSLRVMASLRFAGKIGGLFVTWRSEALGLTIFLHMLPLIGAMTAILIGWGVWMYGRTRRLARTLVSSQQQAQHLSLHDPMTGLANRALFNDRLVRAVDQRQRVGGALALFCIDLDRFKLLNDSLGHQAGDEFIVEVGRRLAGVSRKTDTVARIGGDEFAMIALSANGREGVDLICQRLNQALSGWIDLSSGQAPLSASIGVAIIDNDFTDGDEAIRRADLALYRAKA